MAPSLLVEVPTASCSAGQAMQTTGARRWHVTPEDCDHQGGEETLWRPSTRPRRLCFTLLHTTACTDCYR